MTQDEAFIADVCGPFGASSEDKKVDFANLPKGCSNYVKCVGVYVFKNSIISIINKCVKIIDGAGFQ